MKRLIKKANTNDCMTIIEDFLTQHIDNYIIEHFHTSNTSDNKTNVNVTLRLSDTISIDMCFVCEYNQIIDYNIFVTGSNTTIEDAKEVYEINEEINEYFEENI